MRKNINLTEDTKTQLISRSKAGQEYKDQSKGKNRFSRRNRSSIHTTVKEYNSINMNKFFKEDILDVDIKVKGETDEYLVKISFSGILDSIRRELSRNNSEFDLGIVSKSLNRAFDHNDVYIHCSCPDWKYRFSYWSRINNISSDKNIEQTNNGKEIRNPSDRLGAACKHVLLVLNNRSWLIKVASVIFNYANYMKEHRERLYAEIIYPVLYGKDYEEPVQLTIDDVDNTDNNLDNDQELIDRSNEYARTKNQFKKGNTSGIRFTSEPDEKQFNFDSLIDDEEI